MVLRVLGYEKLESTGTNWAQPVVAKANEIRLFKDVGSSATAPLNRNQVAQLSLNALKADVVTSNVEKDIIVEGVVTIPGKVTYNKVETNEFDYTQADGEYADGTSKDTLQLCEKLYEGDLTFTDAASGDDDFGRPASKWSYNKTDVLVTKTPAVTFVDKTSEDDVKKAVKGYDYLATTSKWENGTETKNQTMTDAAIAALTGDGKLVEIYTDSDKDVTDVVVVAYTVDTVKSITEKNGKTTYKFETATSKYNDEDNTNVIVDGDVDEDDVVTIAKVSGKYYVYPTTSFVGAQSAKKTSDGTVTLTIDGSKYVLSTADGVTSGDFTNSKDDATYYVDKNGFVVKVADLEKKAADYAVIAKVEAAKTNATLDDDAGYSVKVRAVLADGTVKDFTLKTSVDTDLKCGDVTVAASSALGDADQFAAAAADNLAGAEAAGKRPGKLFGYTLKDGKMVLEAVDAGTSDMTKDEKYSVELTDYDGQTSKGDGTATALMTKNTTFVLWSIDDDGKVVVEAPITGTADLSVEDAPGVALVNGNGGASAEAEVVFLKTESIAKEEDYVYIDASDYETGLNDDGDDIDIWQGIAADGSTVEVTGNHAEIGTDGLYVYNTDGELKTPAKVLTNAANHDTAPTKGGYYKMVADVSKNLIKVGNAYVDMDEAEVVSVDEDGAAELENGAKILVVMSTDDADKVAAIFVFEAAPEEEGNDGGVTTPTATVTSTLPENIGEGDTLTEAQKLSVAVKNGTAASYKWQSCATEDGSFSDVAGATSEDYKPVVTTAGTTWYQCVVTLNDADSTEVTSNKIKVEVKEYAAAPTKAEFGKAGNLTQYNNQTVALKSISENDEIKMKLAFTGSTVKSVSVEKASGAMGTGETNVNVAATNTEVKVYTAGANENGGVITVKVTMQEAGKLDKVIEYKFSVDANS